jgi:hypothetical protein
MWEVLAAIKQPGNQRMVNVRVQAPDIVVAKELVQAQYAGSNVKIQGTPRLVHPFGKPKKSKDK